MYSYNKDNVSVKSEVKQLTESHLHLKVKKIENDQTEDLNLSINLNNFEVIDLDDSSLIDFSKNEEVLSYFLDIVKSEIKNSNFERRKKGRIVYGLNIAEQKNFFQKKHTAKDYHSFISKHELEDTIETIYDFFYLNDQTSERLAHSMEKGKSRFATHNIMIKNYHFENKLKMVSGNNKISLFMDEEEIENYELEYSNEKEEAWLLYNESPYYSPDYSEYKKNKYLELYQKDVESKFQDAYINQIERLNPLKEYSLGELYDFDEIKLEGNKSLRLETPLYKYYIKEEKVLIEKFNFKSEQWDLFNN